MSASTVGDGTEPVSRFRAPDGRPPWLREVALASLSAYHRLLVVSDGLTVALIEAAMLERTRVRCVSQRAAAADNPLLAWLHPAVGDRVVRRQVVIEGSRSAVVYLHATSVFVAERLPGCCRSLDAGIGQSLAAGRIETRRELLWWGRGSRWPASRAYRIIIEGAPAFVVYEDFTR